MITIIHHATDIRRRTIGTLHFHLGMELNTERDGCVFISSKQGHYMIRRSGGHWREAWQPMGHWEFSGKSRQAG